MARGGWFKRRSGSPGRMESVPEGVAVKCVSCDQIVFVRDLERSLQVCPRCGHHHRLSAHHRIALTVDEDAFTEMDADLAPADPLGFPDYIAKQRKSNEEIGLSDAIVTGTATIDEQPLVIGVADFGYMGGSMGSVVGEKICRAVDHAIAERLPVVMFTASGGARMHEGLVALMQMTKTSAAVGALARERLPYVTVLTDPTTGGVFASYASLGDVVLAEPGAIVGFAGRRVGNQDLGTKLPDNFQTSEFQLEHGMIDRIVHRKDMRSTLSFLLGFFGGGRVDA
jgi:acetyl-CoA carboxylase carboxyl transferase subunit beta